MLQDICDNVVLLKFASIERFASKTLFMVKKLILYDFGMEMISEL